MNSKNNLTFCTLFDSNYLDKGLALYESMRKHIDYFRLYIFAFDNQCYKVLSDMRLKNVTLVFWQDFMTDRFYRIKEERTRAEFCWTCTPLVIEHVLLKYQEKMCTYIDADIYFFASPLYALEKIVDNNCSVGLVEHRFERDFEYGNHIFLVGKYCIQFNTFLNDETGIEVLEDWKEKCLEWCFSRYEDGKLGDQKYPDKWGRKYSCIYVSQDLGMGVAPWNLHLYSYIEKKDGKIWLKYHDLRFPLVFYHFEGMKYLSDGRIFLHLWGYDNRGINKKVKIIYGEYFNKLRTIRKYLKNAYGITFEHMLMDKESVFNDNYSLKQFCMKEGILNGLKQWIGFNKNGFIRE